MKEILKKVSFILTKGEKNKLLVLLFGTLILAVLETFGIGIIIPIMDLFLNPQKIQTSKALQWLYYMSGAQGITAFLVMLITVATVVFIAKSLYVIFMLYMKRRVVNNVCTRLTTRLLSVYLEKPYTFHLEQNNALLFKNLTVEVSHFCANFLFSLVVVCAEIIVLLAISLLLIYIAPVITLLIGAVLGLILMGMTLFLKKRVKRYSSLRLEASEQIHKFGMEALHAVKEIKIYDAQPFFIERYSHAARKQAESRVKFSIASVLPRHILEAVLWTVVFAVLLVTVYLHKPPSEIIPLMTAVGLAALRFLPSVHRAYMHGNTIRYYANSVDIVYQALKEDDSAQQLTQSTVSGNMRLPGDARPISLKGVDFRFETAPFLLFKGFNIVIPRHKSIAFIGETGAGKSTLVNILMGLLLPNKGKLYYGRTPVTSENIAAYRRKIGYVPQSIFLTDSTLEANIAFGVPEEKISREQLMKVIRTVQLEPFVKGLPAGTKTMVGERGVRLSGGQLQRIGIARALYRNPEILIMDEATSALDGRTESEVNKAIRNLYGTLTIIFISHRLSTIEYADVIYIMERGRIVDQGSLRELQDRSDIFRKITNRVAV